VLKILVIQTSFIGDVILVTPVLEKLHSYFPDSEIDLLLRKGNETLFSGHPYLHKLIIWDKSSSKMMNLMKIVSEVRRTKYDMVINLHRFASSGLITWLSGSPKKIGFDKNPFSFCYSIKVKHEIGNGKHEVERNIELISSFTDNKRTLPKLYPQPSDYKRVREYSGAPYVCIAPSSVWFTKQLAEQKWVELLNKLKGKYKIYLLGSGSDVEMCERIINASENKDIVSLAGKLSFLQSAALMQGAVMNYVNDSAPMHLASSVNTPTIAVFCSTIPAFGFGPLSEKSFIVETAEKLDCRPCGLHGYRACPKGHFKCALGIRIEQLQAPLQR